MLKKDDINKIYEGDVIEVLRGFPSNSIDVCITSPPYWSLRDYGVDGQIGMESTYVDYLKKLDEVFAEVKRVLKDSGSCWVNIGDVYSKDRRIGVSKHSLIGLPDRFKINMIDSGWLCRNEIIWHKPNAMPSSAKTRFNTDYEKFYFFTKSDSYYFNTQYEEAKTKPKQRKEGDKKQVLSKSKYISLEQESSVRQGMNKARGSKLVEVRPLLPSQEVFVEFIRSKTSARYISEKMPEYFRYSKIEHWFRRGKCFSYPTCEDWLKIRDIVKDDSDTYKLIDKGLTYVEYETDDVNKNLERGRIKRAVWSISTKGYKGSHYAPFPEDLVEVPIKASCPPNGVVLDIFMGSGTVGVVARKLGVNYIGIDINSNFIEEAMLRINSVK